MITIDIDPLLPPIGPLTLSWHGIFTMLAVAVGVAVAAWRARGSGFTRDQIYTVAIWAIPGGIVGSRLLHVLDNIDYYMLNPLAALAFWGGGLGLWGAIIGGTLTAAAYAKFRAIPVGKLADLAAPGIILAQAVGRIGCTINGDAYGIPTGLRWAFIYTHPNAAATTRLHVPGHPAPVYEIIWDIIAFAILWKLRRRLPADGMLYLIYISMYSVGRFCISFVREETALVAGLHQAHILALLVLAVALPWLWWLRSQHRRQLQSAGAGSPETPPGPPQ